MLGLLALIACGFGLLQMAALLRFYVAARKSENSNAEIEDNTSMDKNHTSGLEAFGKEGNHRKQHSLATQIDLGDLEQLLEHLEARIEQLEDYDHVDDSTAEEDTFEGFD